MNKPKRTARSLFVLAFVSFAVGFTAVIANGHINASVSRLAAAARMYAPAPFFPIGDPTTSGGGGGGANDTTPNGAALPAPNGPCDDGNACTISDTYVKGVCQGGIPKDCQDGNSCTNDSCTAPTGTCMHASKNCDDANPCTADSCDATSGCTHANQDGALCDDGSPSTTGDLCTAGKCVGTALPFLRGACVVRDNQTNLPSYDDSDSGKGYAKMKKGMIFTSYDAVKNFCMQADYDALGRTFCAGNPGGSYQMQVATYNQDNEYQSTGCGNFGCNYVQCPAASSSSSSAPTWKGICDVRNNHTNLPSYAAPDSGNGYAKVNKGTNFASLNALSATCTQADYDALGRTFCAGNPGGSYQMEVGLFDQNNQYYSNSCGNFGCNYVQCPAASSSSSSAPTWKGICDVRNNHTNLPSYADADAGRGYAKVNKGTNFTSLNEVSATCTQADYDALARTFCAGNLGDSYQMEVGMFDQDNHYYSNSFGRFGSNYVQCPAASSSSRGANGGSSSIGDHNSPPPAGFEEDVLTNTIDHTTLPLASYQDAVLADIGAYKNPFPDTDLNQLTGKAAAELYRRAAIGGFPDGEFKSDRPVNRAEAAKFLLLTRFGKIGDANNNGLFPDVVDGQWYTKFVVTAANKGIINGYPDKLFRPANQVKTAEFLKMLSLTFGLQLNMSYGYSDVPSDSWFAPYAGIAQEYNLFPDRASSLLSPDMPLSRGEVAVAIYQYLVNR